MYLDADGDGINTFADSLSAFGSTTLTVYLNTNRDRDGSLQTCNSHTGAPTSGGPINLFGYSIVLKAIGGTVSWGTFTANDPAYAPLGADLIDSTDTQFTRFRPAQTFTPAGLTALGTIPVTVRGGDPGVVIGMSTSLDPFGFGTDFATQCEGSASANSYLLGTDWFDTDEVRAPAGSGNEAPLLNGPGETNAVAGAAFTVSVDITDPNLGDAVDVTASGIPSGLAIEQGTAPEGRKIATVRGLISKGTVEGDHLIVWSASDGVHPAVTYKTKVRVALPFPSGPDLDTQVKEFVARRYFHGMPGNAARRLGPGAVPILEGLLRNEREKPHWGRVVAALAAIGTPATFDTLRAFVWTRFRGPVDQYTFHALLAAQGSMWRLAASRSDVVNYLEKCADPNYWTDLPWRRPSAPQRSTAVAMSHVSIDGLSCIATPQAMWVLNRLSVHPYDPADVAILSEGIDRQKRVLRMGYEAEFNDELRRLQGRK